MIWFSIRVTRSLYAISAVYQISEPSVSCVRFEQEKGLRRTAADVKNVDVFDTLVAEPDFFLHVDVEWRIIAQPAEAPRRAGHDAQLLVRSSETAQIRDALLQLGVSRVDPNRDELFGAFTRHWTLVVMQIRVLTLSRDIGKVFHVFVPRDENFARHRHGLFELGVVGIHQPLATEDAKDLVVEVLRNSFNEWQRSTNGVRTDVSGHDVSEDRNSRDLKLLVEVSKDKNDCILNLFEIGGRQQFVQGKILHQNVVLVHWMSVRGEPMRPT